MNRRDNTLIENLKTPVNSGLMPAVKADEAFYPSPKHAMNGWWYVGRFEAEGEILGYLAHWMYMGTRFGEPTLCYHFSVTNQTTGKFYHKSELYRDPDIKIQETAEGADRQLLVEVPAGSIKGDPDKVHLEASGDDISLSVDLQSYGNVLYGGGTTSFPAIIGTNINQISVPDMRTKGSITIEGKKYEIEGSSWFDRQWQTDNPSDPRSIGKWKWNWFNICLDNGEVLGVWDMYIVSQNVNYCWATVLHPDGTQTIDVVERTEFSNYWKSERSGKNYPLYSVIKLPNLDVELEIKPVVEDQEMGVPGMIAMFEYEGLSDVKGTYKGQPVKGYSYYELVGAWE